MKRRIYWLKNEWVLSLWIYPQEWGLLDHMIALFLVFKENPLQYLLFVDFDDNHLTCVVNKINVPQFSASIIYNSKDIETTQRCPSTDD